MQIHHLNCGTFNPISRKAFNGNGRLFERGDLVSHCLLVEHDFGHVLIDTGLGQSDLALPKGRIGGPIWKFINRPQLVPTEMAESQLIRLGLHPKDIRHIVLTHLDFDTAGAISDFPNATIHAWDREYLHAMSPKTLIDRARYSERQLGGKLDWRFYKKTDSQWFGLECVRAIDPLAPEILIIPLGGHTGGHCAVALNTGEGWILHAGDAFMYRGEIESEPSCPTGLRMYQNALAHDKNERADSVDLLRNLHLKHGKDVRIICSRDPVMYEQSVTLARPSAAYLR